MQAIPSARSASPLTSHAASDAVVPPVRCLNCGASLAAAYCGACGQKKVDLIAPTWDVLREALADATDLDGRVLRTVRAIGSPGRLTLEFLRGRRVRYVGPLTVFLIVGAALSTTWVLTRGADARYYGFPVVQSESASGYISTVVRGLLAASAALAVSSWMFSRGRRRLLDEAVFSLHVVAAISLWVTVVIWLATAWKLMWATVERVPRAVPSLVDLIFLPAAVVGLLYVAGTIWRVHGVAWWAAALRTMVFAVVGVAAVYMAIVAIG